MNKLKDPKIERLKNDLGVLKADIKELIENFEKMIEATKKKGPDEIKLKEGIENKLTQELKDQFEKLDVTNIDDFDNTYTVLNNVIVSISTTVFSSDYQSNFFINGEQAITTMNADDKIGGILLSTMKKKIDECTKELNRIKIELGSMSVKIFHYLKLFVLFGAIVILIVTIVGYIICFILAFYYAIKEERQKSKPNYLMVPLHAFLGPIYLYAYFRL